MRIDISSVLDRTEDFLQFEGNLDLNCVDLGNRDISIVGSLIYKGSIYRVDGQLEMDMELTYNYEEDCHRCLKPAINKVKNLITGKLSKAKHEDNEEEGFEEVFYYEDDFLEIDNYIENQVILSLPMKSLCGSDCKGLCTRCGTDLNNKECDCIVENIDPRFEKLKNFFPNK